MKNRIMRNLLSTLILLTVPIFIFGQSIESETYSIDSILECANPRHNPNDSIVLDWVKMDLKIIANQINPLQSKGVSIDSILEIMPDFLDGENNSLSTTLKYDFGLKMSRHTIFGGYASHYIDVLYYQNKVLKIRVTLHSKAEIIENYLIKEIQLPFRCHNGGISCDLIFQHNLDGYRATIGKLFIEAEDPASYRAKAISYFLDVYTGGEFIKPYFMGTGLGTKTIEYLRYFVENNDFNALEYILFSPSPTSRLMSARTLVYLKEKKNYAPTEEVMKRIEVSIDKAEPIESGIISCFLGRFEHDIYDFVNDYEKYLKED